MRSFREYQRKMSQTHNSLFLFHLSSIFFCRPPTQFFLALSPFLLLSFLAYNHRESEIAFGKKYTQTALCCYFYSLWFIKAKILKLNGKRVVHKWQLVENLSYENFLSHWHSCLPHTSGHHIKNLQIWEPHLWMIPTWEKKL